MTSRAIPLCPVSHPSGDSAGVGAVGLSRRQPRSAGDGPAAARRSTGLPLLRSALQLLTPARARRECACAETRHARGLRTRPGVRGRGAEPPPPNGSHRSHRPPPSPPGVSPRVSTRAWWPQDTPSQRVPVALAASAPRLQHSGRPAPPPRPGGRSRAHQGLPTPQPRTLRLQFTFLRLLPLHGHHALQVTSRRLSSPPRQVPVLQHPLPRATADNASPSPAHALPASRAVAHASHAPVPSSSHPTASRLHPYCGPALHCPTDAANARPGPDLG